MPSSRKPSPRSNCSSADGPTGWASQPARGSGTGRWPRPGHGLRRWRQPGSASSSSPCRLAHPASLRLLKRAANDVPVDQGGVRGGRQGAGGALRGQHGQHELHSLHLVRPRWRPSVEQGPRTRECRAVISLVRQASACRSGPPVGSRSGGQADLGGGRVEHQVHQAVLAVHVAVQRHRRVRAEAGGDRLHRRALPDQPRPPGPIAAATISSPARDRCLAGGGGGWVQISGAGSQAGWRTVRV